MKKDQKTLGIDDTLTEILGEKPFPNNEVTINGAAHIGENQRKTLKALVQECVFRVYGSSWVRDDVREHVAEAAAQEYDKWQAVLDAAVHNLLLEMDSSLIYGPIPVPEYYPETEEPQKKS